MTISDAFDDPRFVMSPPPIVSLAVDGTDARFPVRRIYCVGRNYADHAIEMGHDPSREPPFFFQKNSDNLVSDRVFPYPAASNDVHHEIELMVALVMGGANIPEADALDHVLGFGVALDMTRRDLQGEAKKLGRPWVVGKAFEASAPASALVPASCIGHPTSGRIWLNVDGVKREDGDLAQMIWTVPETIAILSRLFVLRPGDIILTGTPAGVGPVSRGERIKGGVEGVGTIDITVV